MPRQHIPTLFQITVAGGEGSVSLHIDGDAIGLSMIPPGSGTYDLEVLRIDPNDATREHGRTGRAGQSGNCVIQEEWQAYPNTKVKVSNAVDDGIYYGEISYKG